MARLELTEQSGRTILLASQAQQKIDAAIGGIRMALPLTGGDNFCRNFFVVRDSKNKPGQVQLQEWRESERSQPLQGGMQISERSLADIPSPYRSISPPDVLIFARNSTSNVPEQPVVDGGTRGLDQGFRGASNRVRSIRENNEASPNPVEYDYIVGIENAQVVFNDEDTQGKTIEVVEDVGFVVVENRLGQRRYTHSAGVTFGNEHGTDYFAQAEASGFSTPAGHFYSPEEPQDPHKKATGELYTRTQLLIPPLASALRQLEEFGRTS